MHAWALARPMEAAGRTTSHPRLAWVRAQDCSSRTPSVLQRGAFNINACAVASAALVWAGVQRQRWPSRRNFSLVRAVAAADTAVPKPVPIILLSGFLGTGKTTLLRHWLENSTDRVGIVVNDVAAVNIDSKLVQQQTYNAEGEVNAIQLENGCACCSLGDELLVNIHDLLELTTGDRPFSHIVVELSGVAEPARVKENFVSAKESGYYVVNGVEMGKVVTLLDASTFCEDYMEYSRLYEREDLMDGDVGEMEECAVVELLVEQTEAADIVVLNKTDLATKEQLDATRAVVKGLNQKAAILETAYGKLTLTKVLEAATAQEHKHLQQDHEEHSGCSHSHEEHGHEAKAEHSHEDCHEEEHGHSHASDCSDPGCSDHSHDHDHGHGSCSDPDCSDSGHSHEHSHGSTTAEDRFGITSFTYRARRPFSEERFTEVLKKWPIPKHTDIQLMLSDVESDAENPMTPVIRSKGFCWLESQPSTRVYWSHAGKEMLLTYNGLWWAAMSEDQIRIMKQLGAGAYQAARREDWNDEWGDRRQELVFIGRKLDEAAIREQLNECLLTDDEMVAYKKVQEAELQEREEMRAAERV
mmetsp:Transcript_27416/g.63864  ORF Transcript_27416/g.63864 Transcript_27416/m.63864 type:complete len:585 (+) Transcript_27416:61-1815(+)